MIKAVFFDLDGTLYDRDALVKGLLADQFEQFRADLDDLCQGDFVARIVELDDHGYGDKAVVYQRVVVEWGLKPDLAERLVEDFWARYESHCVLDEDVRGTLEALRRQEKKLGVITNGGALRQQRKLDALGISACFDVILISEVEGIRKPDRAIFQRALDRSGVQAAEAVFVGDHPEVDIEGAMNAGLTAIWKFVPYWSSTNSVPTIRRLSEILPLCLSDDDTAPAYSLRPATDADLPFMYRIHCLGLGPYITLIRGWDEEKERTYFLGRFVPTSCEVIVHKHEDVGWCHVEDNGDHLRLDYVVLAPEYQRRGIGASIVKDLLRRATRRAVPVRLNVLRVNPAKALYERLGFVEVGGDEYRFFMESRPT